MTITKLVDRKLKQFCNACYIINQGVLMGAFTGKTVLILGGSRGIGAAIVRRFVTDGANVRFTYAGSKMPLNTGTRDWSDSSIHR